jgi:hypothetical protein
MRTVQDVVERAHVGELEKKHADAGCGIDGVAEQADDVVVPEPRQHQHLLPQELVVRRSEALQVREQEAGG